MTPTATLVVLAVLSLLAWGAVITRMAGNRAERQMLGWAVVVAMLVFVVFYAVVDLVGWLGHLIVSAT